MDSGEFLSGDAMLSHAIEQHNIFTQLLEDCLKVIGENVRLSHALHMGTPGATVSWGDCTKVSCVRVQELKARVEEACGVKV